MSYAIDKVEASHVTCEECHQRSPLLTEPFVKHWMDEHTRLYHGEDPKPLIEWDVLRDEQGEPVTLTPLQVRALWQAIRVWRDVCRVERSHQAEYGLTEPNLAKSRLLGRMLIDGRPPLLNKPPHYVGAAGYHLVEGEEIGHYYLNGGVTPILMIAKVPVQDS